MMSEKKSFISRFDLLEFLSRESPREVKRVAVLSIFSGLSNMALISLINESASEVVAHHNVTWQFCLFTLLIVIYLIGTTIATRANIASAQALVHKFKMRIMSQVIKSQLPKVDSIGRPEILQVVARDAQMISQSVSLIVSASQSLATVICLTAYMAFVSLTAFAITAIGSILFSIIGVISLRRLSAGFKAAWSKDSASNEIFSDFLSGFQEIKMDSNLARDITRELITESRVASQEKGELLTTSAQYFNYLQVLMFVIVGLLIYVVPILSPDISSSVTQATTTALFIAGSLSGLIQTVPALTQANMSAKSLKDLQDKLAVTDLKSTYATKQNERFWDLKTLTLEDVSYQHPQKDGSSQFALGPVSYTFEAGKVYFVRGRNGSGKTTLVRLLTGLYSTDAGRILVNEREIQQPASNSYRDLFSVVFSDFYLFKKAYGLSGIKESEFTEMFELFEIADKVSINEGVFSNIKLSTGQRKRLALIVALLQKKPILILDEWAADQDPQFRKEFYEVIIPRIRALGKMVIAITHDDHYYASADEVLHVVNGKLIKQANKI